MSDIGWAKERMREGAWVQQGSVRGIAYGMHAVEFDEPKFNEVGFFKRIGASESQSYALSWLSIFATDWELAPKETHGG